MKNLIKGTMVSVFLFVLFAFAFAVHEIIPSETQLALPGPDAGQLNEYIVRYNPYTSWDLWPNKGRLYRGTEPHGSLLTTFVNDSAYYSIKNKAPMTDGAIIAKENYTADKKFVALTVMHKIKGYNPEVGDWFWVKYAPDGKVLASGKVKGCIQCHSAKKDNDYIFTGKVAK
jgi:hypothetical protein